MKPPILSASDLCVGYGKSEVVHGITLEVGVASIVTIVGTNGAGKSTTLNALIGLLPAKGKVFIDGEDCSRISLEGRVARRVCLVPEKRELFGSLSVEQNLWLGGFALASRAEMQEELEKNFRRFPRLKERRTQLASTLSGGERQMLAMGRALMAKPRLLILDEPSLGLAPLIVKDIFSMISQLRGDGVSVLIVEQNARAALQIADFGYLMELGEIRRAAPAADLLADDHIVRAYLGG